MMRPWVTGMLLLMGSWTVVPTEARSGEAERGPRVAVPQPRRRAQISRRSVGPPRGKWLGQDGHDSVGYSAQRKTSDVQDIHVRLTNLPPGREIAALIVRGFGGDEWQYGGGPNTWLVDIERDPGATTAEVYFEPCRQETGRGFDFEIRYADGTSARIWVQGGRADPNLRMPEAALEVRWAGQGPDDRVGSGPAVGPDGYQDVRLELGRLSEGVEVQSATVQGPEGLGWSSGLNPQGLANAELVRDPQDSSRAEVFLQPPRDLQGQTLHVTVAYPNGKTDRASVVAGGCDPRLSRPVPRRVRIDPLGLTARWLGQDGTGGRGEVHLVLEGLPAGKLVVAAALSDPARGFWAKRWEDSSPLPFQVEPFAGPLTFRPLRGDPTRADLHFPPCRDETGSTLTLRLLFADGSSGHASLTGGRCDPARRADDPSPTQVVAHPGDDLHRLVERFGTVRLSRGTYPLDQPLVLNRPVTIVGEAGAILTFSQPPTSPPWSTAIKVRDGHTTLEGFAVRFAGPIRWAEGVNYGPAVVGTTDNLDPPGHAGTLAGLVLTRLDLESPPAARPGEEAVRLLRLVSALSGRIDHNTLKGGTIEFQGGPWEIVENSYQGTVPDTTCSTIFGGHNPHDLLLKGNTARPVGPSGKTWRFLVLTGSGFGDVIEGNEVLGIGPRDDDTGPPTNAPEVLLTESYRLRFEGHPSGLSADGRVLYLPGLPGGPVRSGDVVAILSGPDAGQWLRVAQGLDPTTVLLDQPLTRGRAAVAIVDGGFVSEVFRNNTVDCRGSFEGAAPLVLVGNHFGTQVVGNHLLGGRSSFKLTSAPTEGPVFWGWSHAPFLGVVIAGNVLEDSAHGAMLAVEHGPAVKSNRGRVYLSARLEGNTTRWTPDFLTAHPDRARALPPGIMVGDPGSLDPGELVLTSSANRVDVPPGVRPPPAVQVEAATATAPASPSRYPR